MAHRDKLRNIESIRAAYNLQEAVRLRATLEWTKQALRMNLCDKEAIIKEIDIVLKREDVENEQ